MSDTRKSHERLLFDAIDSVSDTRTASFVVMGNDRSMQENDAAWVKNAMSRLESKFDRDMVIKIRQGCQCGIEMDHKLALVKRLIDKAKSMADFGNDPEATSAGLSVLDGVLHLQFPFCPCPLLATVEALETDSWCQCTTGYSKVLFEKAFGCAVDVTLLKSVKMGDEICLMKIIPQSPIW